MLHTADIGSSRVAHRLPLPRSVRAALKRPGGFVVGHWACYEQNSASGVLLFRANSLLILAKFSGESVGQALLARCDSEILCVRPKSLADHEGAAFGWDSVGNEARQRQSASINIHIVYVITVRARTYL